MLDLPPQLPADLPPARLTFEERFEQFDHAAETWRTRSSGTGSALSLPDNGDLQLYVDPAFTGAAEVPLGLDPFTLEGDALVLRAIPTPPALEDAVWGYPYLSGMLSTLGSHAQTYGYFEIRARMPSGQGRWVSLWLMPVRPVWPPEIDIAEVLGQRTDQLWINLHTTIEDAAPTCTSRCVSRSRSRSAATGRGRRTKPRPGRASAPSTGCGCSGSTTSRPSRRPTQIPSQQGQRHRDAEEHCHSPILPRHCGMRQTASGRLNRS
jgi:hypothetical protein